MRVATLHVLISTKVLQKVASGVPPPLPSENTLLIYHGRFKRFIPPSSFLTFAQRPVLATKGRRLGIVSVNDMPHVVVVVVDGEGRLFHHLCVTGHRTQDRVSCYNA